VSPFPAHIRSLPLHHRPHPIRPPDPSTAFTASPARWRRVGATAYVSISTRDLRYPRPAPSGSPGCWLSTSGPGKKRGTSARVSRPSYYALASSQSAGSIYRGRLYLTALIAHPYFLILRVAAPRRGIARLCDWCTICERRCEQPLI
jgi:hypothetical protein